MNKNAIKEKLWAAVDTLGDADGFVLVATAEEISFTHLRAAGWDEHMLELEPLRRAELTRENTRLAGSNLNLERHLKALNAEIAEKEQRLADLNAAISNALGGKP